MAIPDGAVEALEEVPKALEGSGVGGGFSPDDLQSAYSQSGEGGAGQTVAIVDAFDDPNAESDLAAYRSYYGLPECTTANGCFKKVNQAGETANYPAASESWSLEISLDLDMVSALCPHCHILLVEANDSYGESLYPAEERAVAMGATEVSNSWGSLEHPDESEQDEYFNHPGVPITFSAGDRGYKLLYPAASPYVISVGGTALRKDAGSRGWREEAWVKTGSGCSAYEAKPAWQKDPQCAYRMVSDVSAVAATETPVSIYDSYGVSGWVLVGGTSASSPLISAVEALSSPSFRALGPKAFYEGSGGLVDVTTGTNGICTPPPADEYFCTAQLGYDGPTGNGTPGLSQTDAKPVVAARAGAAEPYEATLEGTVNPRGSATTYRFEYGPTVSYGDNVPTSEASAGSGSSNVAVVGHPSELAIETTYHFRLVATNSHGTTYGEDETFITTGPEWASLPSYASTFGSSPGHPGAGPGQLDHPDGIAVDPRNGNLAVADTRNNRIEEFTPSGEFIREFGSEGPGAAQFEEPKGLAFDRQDNLYVSDSGNGRIEKFTADGVYLATIGEGKLNLPWGIAVDSDNHIWVAQWGTTSIKEFLPSGEVGGQIATLSRPHGLVLDTEGHIWTDTSASKIEEYSQSGARLRRFGIQGLVTGQTWWLEGLAVDAQGNVWVTNQCSTLGNTMSNVEVFSNTGRFEGSFGTYGVQTPQQMQYPGDVTIDPRGNVWVIDQANNRVTRWTIPSEWPPTHAASFDSRPAGLLSSVAVSPKNGHIAVANRWEYMVEVFNSAGEFVRRFETKPEGGEGHPCQFGDPRAVAFDREGKIWVAGYKCIEHFTENGGYLNTLGSEGSGPGQFEAAMGIAVDSDEDVWVVDSGNERIEELSPEGEFLQQFAAGGWGIAIDGDDNVWSDDFSGELQAGRVVWSGTLEEHSQEGGLLQKIGEGSALKEPMGLGVDGDGNVWVTDEGAHQIEVFSPTGEYLDAFGTSEQSDPRGIAVDPHGNVWIADIGYGRMERWIMPSLWPSAYTPSFEASFGSAGSASGQFNEPTAVAVSPKTGNLAVVDRANDRVEELNSAGEYVRQFGGEGSGLGQFKSPQAVAFDKEGHIYVVDSGNARVEKFSEAGALLGLITGEGTSGQLKQPTDIAIDGAGDLWVADCENRAVEKFGPGGAFLRQYPLVAVLQGTEKGSACPVAIAVDSKGHLFADFDLFPAYPFLFFSNGQVDEYDRSSGQLIRTIAGLNAGTGLSGPRGLAVDAEGNLWVADSSNGRIEVFDPRGMYVGTFGTRGSEAGQFKKPFDIALGQGGSGIWVADSQNNRVDLWR